MKLNYSSNWSGGLSFETGIGSHIVRTDAPKELGGADSGPNPKALMIAALAGCTGIDVVNILEKMRIRPDAFKVDVEVDASDEPPSVYKSIVLIYRFTGNDLDMKKLRRAVELSQEKYCGVSMMYQKAMDISYEIVVE